ncbi:sulfotransferase family 2 domain-containing protein [Pantoea sp.]|uniref:sulfotransferase family 2 domain-containing protein n=1 Tax=Pantoea sp. TaxID=69393 RepID=UPI0028985ED0|nr:sulfotransferase family 2 domain-containing protein [Pantoea sp.]
MDNFDKSKLPPDFDAEVYLYLNPDVKQSGMDAATHYCNYGRAEKRPYRNLYDKSQLPQGFDPKAYLELNPDVGDAGLEPEKHYLDFGCYEKRPYRYSYERSALPEDFNPLVYYALNPDVKLAKQNAQAHYLNYGAAEQRSYKLADTEPLPADFDPELYRTMYNDVMLSGADPVLHYLLYGRAEGRIYNFSFPTRRPPAAKPMFFLHIPKTAGSSFNDYVQQKMTCATHIENQPAIYDAIHKRRADFDFVSGHLKFEDKLSVIHSPQWFKFTFLREPIEQVISHIKWVRSFSTHSRRHEIKFYPDEKQQLFQQLSQVSLSDIETLQKLLDSSCEFRNFFDNCQVRYLTNDNIMWVKNIHYETALQNALSLDAVAFCETADRDSVNILNAAGWPTQERSFPKSNPSPSNERPDLDNPYVLAFYEKLTCFDRKLYNQLKAIKNNAAEFPL